MTDQTTTEPKARAFHLVHDHDGHEPHTWTDVDGNWLHCPGSGEDADGRTAQERADDADRDEQYQLYREAVKP
jgi:hypothetical protein